MNWLLHSVALRDPTYAKIVTVAASVNATWTVSNSKMLQAQYVELQELSVGRHRLDETPTSSVFKCSFTKISLKQNIIHVHDHYFI
jgi:hypothetical protein